MENTPKTLLEVHLASQTFTGLFFNCVVLQFSSKVFFDWPIFPTAYAIEIFHCEKVKIRHSILL